MISRMTMLCCLAAMAPIRMITTAFPVSRTSTSRVISTTATRFGRSLSSSSSSSSCAMVGFSRSSCHPYSRRCDDSNRVCRFMSTGATAAPDKAQGGQTSNKKVPITLLSGFLGAGKTVTLKHLLENTEGYKLGIIVNDVASINIDSKLVAGSNNGVVELQNGCTCCSLADEFLTSVDGLLSNKDREYDAIVVELSGVADPVAIKMNWNSAKRDQHPVTEKADMSQVVTLVDASTFGTDWMTWDVAAQREGWVEPGDDCAGQLKVPELLAEQIEAANVILVNKVDLAGPDQVKIASSLVKSMNDKAILEEVEFGRISPQKILQTKPVDEEPCNDPDCTDSSHSHSHDHAADSSHSHSHDHASDCADPGCTDTSHSHSHDHAASCDDPGCTDSSHSHSHDHAASCDDPGCTDSSHSHSHDHSPKTSTDQLGIVNFVYKADRPFNLRRLLELLNSWPVPIKDTLDMGLIKEVETYGGYETEDEDSETSPFNGVLRSKGFCWLAPTRWSGRDNDVWRHDTAMYWSHAGKHFGITSAGKWWGTLTDDQMKKYFSGNEKEYERILKEDFVSDEFKDRRQELVFIGVGINQKKITDHLNSCLVSEKAGMQRYRQELSNYMNTVWTSPAGGSGLFDIGSVDHMDVDK